MWRSLSPCVTGGSGWLRIAHCWRSAQILAAAPPSQRNPTLGSYPPPSWEPGLSLPPHKTYSVTALPGPTAGSTTAGGTMAGGITPQALLVLLHWCYLVVPLPLLLPRLAPSPSPSGVPQGQGEIAETAEMAEMAETTEK